VRAMNLVHISMHRTQSAMHAVLTRMESQIPCAQARLQRQELLDHLVAQAVHHPLPS
jgi:hypothetical protein